MNFFRWNYAFRVNKMNILLKIFWTTAIASGIFLIISIIFGDGHARKHTPTKKGIGEYPKRES